MAQARIYKPSKTAMQSGKAKTHGWVLEFSAPEAGFIDSVMGWRGSNDTLHQVRLTFKTLEAALAYAKKRHLQTQIEPLHNPHASPKSYANNFRHDRPH